MSITGLSSKSSLHWRNNSGELDVFEAARYFSGADENPGYNHSSFSPVKDVQRAARMSLDIQMIRNPINDNTPMIRKQLKESKKYKHPRSPCGRLAGFLNLLFNQTNSKKKKSKSGTKDVNLDQEESPGGRKRRSSISHFRIGTSNSGNESKTPTKSSYKEFRSLSEAISVHKNGGDGENDEEFRYSNGNGFKNGSFPKSTANWIGGDEEEEKGFRKFSAVDDGADSDSSSDLFDLPNYDLDLPVYGTTNMDRIRIGAPISSAAAV